MNFPGPGRRAVAAFLAIAALAGLVQVAAAPREAEAQTNPCSWNPPYDPGWFSPCWDYTGAFADPVVVRYGSKYYAYGTVTGGAHLPVATSSSPSGPWRPRAAYGSPPSGMAFANNDPFFNDALVRPPQWAAGDGAPGHHWLRQEVWAPTIGKFGDTWVAYYAVRVHGRGWDSPYDADSAPGYFGNARFCLSYATASSPLGPFRDNTTGPFYCGEDLDAHLYGGRYGGNGERANPAGLLDPSIFIDPADRTPYLLFKTEGKVTGDRPFELGHPTEIVIRQLQADGTGFAPGSRPIRIASTAERSWEGMVIENPSMVVHQGRYLLFYSGGDWGLGRDVSAERRAYSTGYRECAGPTGGCGNGPGVQVLRSSAARVEYGPGGGNAFTDSSGRLWLSYHYWDTPTPGAGSVRRLRTTPISSECGAIGIPVPGMCELVKAAYQDFLGRPSNGAETAYWAGALSTTLGVRDFMGLLARSELWLGNTVDRMYQDTLGRKGDSGGRAFWIGQLRSGNVSVAHMAALFYGSSEYFRTYGGNDLGTWITDLYHKLLGRAPEPGGVSYWVRRARQVGRDRVALDFYQSVESRVVRVRGLYQALLGRDPDFGGLVHWGQQVLVWGDIALAVELASSPEYAARARARF